MTKYRRLTSRAFHCLCASLLVAGVQPQRVLAQDAAPATDAKKPHHATNLKGWETKGEEVKSGDPLTTTSLSKEMHEAIASIVLATKASTTAKFDQKSKEEKPFWSGIKGADSALNAMDKGLAAKDQKAYLTGESDLGRNVSELNVSWKLLGKKDEAVDKGLLALNRSYRIFDEHYGAEAARRKAGGDLTDAEKANLEKLRAEQADLVTKLKALKAEAKKEKNKVAAEMVADLERKANRVSKSKGDGVDNYTHECTLLSEESDELYAYNTILVDYYPKSDFYTEWTTLDSDRTAVSGYYTEFESAEYTVSLDYTSESVTEYGDYYDVAVDVSVDEETSSEEYAESYSEDEATEEVADEETSVDEDESEDVEAEDADSSGDEDSLDDEGDSEEMEADDEPDEGDEADDSDSDDDDGGDDSSIAVPSRTIMVAEVAPEILSRYWPAAVNQ